MRPGAFENGFSFGEPELDANSALTELDKGLRSTKLGEQVEAIVRFPVLFERYPFPILINSAFLKLADVFRTGSNFLRLWVFRVCQQTERHLDKILNVDEFVRRIFSVIYANDPIARALTLRTMGSLSGLIPERKKVHHSIRVALDSNDKVEVSAAICAASCFAQKSKTFGTTMCVKIASMVQRLSTPIDLKLKLIPIFQYMHHDIETASMVRKLCVNLLANYPSQQFVTIILHTLTQLAAATIADLTEQVEFLLSYLEDSRAEVKISVLKDLKLLGDNGGHLWETSHVSTLISMMEKNYKNETDMEVESVDKSENEIRHAALDVLYSITPFSAISSFVPMAESPLRTLLESNIHSTDIISALKAIRIATALAINWDSDSGSTRRTDFVGIASSGIESLLTSLCSQTVGETGDERLRTELFSDLEKCLTCGVMLAKADATKCEWLCEVLIRIMKFPGLAARSKNLIAQAIGSIGSRHIESVIKCMPELLGLLKISDKETIEKDSSTIATLVAIVFQAHQGYTLSCKTKSVIHSMLQMSNSWLAYRIARNSLRYSQPEAASIVFKELKSYVSLENFHYWLCALHSIAEAEHLLCGNNITGPRLISRIQQATSLYVQGVSTVKAASSPTNSLQFQTEFLRIRSEMLVAFSNLLVSCNSLHFSPAADLASSFATIMRDELLKSGRVVTQLRKCVREFQGIGEMYARLYQTAFDADNDSLLNIQILQQMCRLVARSIEKHVFAKDHPSFSDDDESLAFFSNMDYINSSNSWTLVLSCNKALDVLNSMKTLPTQVVTPTHIDCLRQIARLVVETPLPFPRFFFQTLQMTRVKIAVSPQPRNIGESVAIMHGNNLVLKVEGVIQQNCSKADDSKSGKVFRKPKAIRLTVVSTPLPNPRMHMADQMKMSQEPITLVKDVTPHRDFFQSQFLLIVSSGGLTNVTVDTSLVDFEGRAWMTGPRATLSVRVLDDSSISTKQQSTTISIPGPTSSSSSRPMNLGPNSIMLQRY